MVKDTYRTIKEHSEGLYKEKGSKFIAHAHPVSSEEEVKILLEEYRKTYYDARHVCYAYRLGSMGEQYRQNDDGEPSGTAGKPILGQLLSFDVTYILVIVIRYFGGVKLGVSGLIGAYREAAQDALMKAETKECIVTKPYRLTFDYPLMNDVMRLLKEEEPEIKNQIFELSCTIDIGIRLRDEERIVARMQQLYGLAIKKL
ncbi:IMPACT family protein [Saccharicrinis sp. FJH54]|uniref:IMPACT family protein n=1 Tax=Saccharicrinis sp. FJH54 TaxID=3344665 RepID=UPI0035D441B4